MSALDVAMTETEAKQTTAGIKKMLSTITEANNKVVLLIEKAESGRAWQALGYPSWTAYVAGEFADALAGLARAERVPIVAKFSSAGMPTRSIAAVTGTSVGTVHNDVVAAGVQPLNTSIGADGKTYPRPTFLPSGKPDATTVEEFGRSVPQSPRKAPRRPLPRAYRDAVYDLQKAVERLQRLTADDRFPHHAEELFTANQATLTRLAEALHDDVRMPLVRGGRDE